MAGMQPGRVSTRAIAQMAAIAVAIWAGIPVAESGAQERAALGDYGARLVAAPDGSVTVLWARSAAGNAFLQATRLDPSGNQGPVHTLPIAGATGSALVSDPQGQATVVWSSSNGLHLLRLNADASAGATSTLAGQEVARFRVDADPAGGIHVAWLDRSATQVLRTARFAPDGSPGDPITVSAGGGTSGFDVAGDGAGGATVVRTANARIESAKVAPDGTTGPPQLLSQDFALDIAAIADSAGRVTAAWSGNATFGAPPVARAARIGADGVPGPVSELGPSSLAGPLLAVDSQDRVTAVWGGRDATGPAIVSTRFAADGTQGPLRTLARPSSTSPSAIASDPQGALAVVWTTDQQVEAVRVAADETVGAVETLAPPRASNPAVAIDPNGRATFAWTHLPGSRAEFSPLGRIEAVQIEAGGTRGPVRALSTGDDSPPEVEIEAESRQRLRDAVLIRVSCDEVCDLFATGKIVIPRGRVSAPGRRELDLEPASATTYCVKFGIPCHPRPRMLLDPAVKPARVAQRALEHGRRVSAVVDVFAGDSTGNIGAAQSRVRLQLGRSSNRAGRR